MPVSMAYPHHPLPPPTPRTAKRVAKSMGNLSLVSEHQKCVCGGYVSFRRVESPTPFSATPSEEEKCFVTLALPTHSVERIKSYENAPMCTIIHRSTANSPTFLCHQCTSACTNNTATFRASTDQREDAIALLAPIRKPSHSSSSESDVPEF